MKRFVILASGEGSTFLALAQAARDGRLAAQLVGLVVHRASAGAVQLAQAHHIPVFVVDPKESPTRAQWDRLLTAQVRALAPHLVVLAGFTQLLGREFLTAFAGQVVNTHPALLPKYGGPGMYGRHVHEAVLKAKEKETGVSVHWVEAEYDSGPVISQTRVRVRPDDTPDTLAARVKAIEKDFYVSVLAELFKTPSQ